MGSGEVAIVALSTMISLKVTFSDGLGGVTFIIRMASSICVEISVLILFRLAILWSTFNHSTSEGPIPHSQRPPPRSTLFFPSRIASHPNTPFSRIFVTA